MQHHCCRYLFPLPHKKDKNITIYCLFFSHPKVAYLFENLKDFFFKNLKKIYIIKIYNIHDTFDK